MLYLTWGTVGSNIEEITFRSAQSDLVCYL